MKKSGQKTALFLCIQTKNCFCYNYASLGQKRIDMEYFIYEENI